MINEILTPEIRGDLFLALIALVVLFFVKRNERVKNERRNKKR